MVATSLGVLLSWLLFVRFTSAYSVSLGRDVAVVELSTLIEDATTLAKREEKKDFAKPVSVAASQYWEGNDGPWSSFVLQVGNRSQEVRVLPSTASSSTWVVFEDVGCRDVPVQNCAASRGKTFNPNASATWITNPQWSIYELGVDENLLGRKVYGEYAQESVMLGHLGGGGPSVQRSVVAGIGDTHFSWLGVLGMNARPVNFTNLPGQPQPSLVQLLKDQGNISSLSWAYTAGAQYKPNPVFGSLVLGGYDTSRFTRPAETNPALNFPFYTDIERDLLVGITSINTTSTINLTSSNELLTEGIYALIDSTVPHLWLPEHVCTAFESAFGLQWDPDTELYKLSAEQHEALVELNPSVVFHLSPSLPPSAARETVAITLPYSAFDLNVSWPYGNGPYKNESAHYFPLKRATDPGQYTLGRAFLQEAYVIADYERQVFSVWPCKWDENTMKENLVSILLPGASSETADSGGRKLSTGAIAGISVGVVAIIVILSIAIWIYLRRRRPLPTPIASTTTDSTPPLSPYPAKSALATEIAGTEKHELHEVQIFEAEPGGKFELDGEDRPHEAEGLGLFEMDAGGDGVGLVDSHGEFVRITVEPPTAVSPKPKIGLPIPVSRKASNGLENSTLSGDGNETVKSAVDVGKEDGGTGMIGKGDEKDGVRSFFGFLKAFRASGKT